MDLIPAILPVALAIAAGWALRTAGVVKDDVWPAVETFSFRVLIPAILIHSVASADLSPSRIGAFALGLFGAVALVGGGVLVLRAVVAPRVPGPVAATLFQCAIRFNGFVSLAVADRVVGGAGMSMIGVSMALLIPVINVASIVVLAMLCGGSTGPRRIARTIVTNPLVIGSAAGIALNLAGGLPDVVAGAMEIVGRAALGVGLLAVGAGIELSRLWRVGPKLLGGLLLRPVLITGVFLGLGLLLGLSQVELIAGILVFTAPAATNGYIVTKAMGGDADLYADLIGWQTILTLVAIPAYLALVM